EVASAGSQLAVLPELFPFQPAAIVADPARAAARSAELLQRIRETAAASACRTVASLVEADAGRYYSTAWLVDDRGDIAGRYRQTHLWSTERAWATPGDDLPVFETPFGRIGMLIGYD